MKYLDIIISFVIAVIFSDLMFSKNPVLTKIHNDMSCSVGKRVVVDSDTLTIVNFNIFSDNFHLSNGIKIDSSYLKTYKEF